MVVKDSIEIIKIGGKIIDSDPMLSRVLDGFSSIVCPKILVHGGGSRASAVSKALNIPVQMVKGRRITDASTLEVVTMVYAGLINKNIVAQLQKRKVNAIGMSGADAGLIESNKRENTSVDFGFVGDIRSVDTEMLINILELGLIPVICALTHDGSGNLLNTNADTIAAELAKSLSEHFTVKLKYCFEYPGVLLDVRNSESTIAEINQEYFEKLIEENIIHSGMLPKISNALSSRKAGVDKVCICGADNLKNEKNVTWIM